MSFRRTVFSIPKMDCGAEELQVRTAVGRSAMVRTVAVDLELRQATVLHEGSAEDILKLLVPLTYGAKVAESEEMGLPLDVGEAGEASTESATLKIVLAINAGMFIVEMVMGWLANSSGLISDSLDMFADASVYGLSLYAVGKAAVDRRRAAFFGGYSQLILAALALGEVFRRFIFGSDPEFAAMVWVSVLALAANTASLYLLRKHRRGGVHMRASIVFTNSDVIANLGVMLAGVLVYVTGTNLPDLAMGLIIAAVVIRSALVILKMAKLDAD